MTDRHRPPGERIIVVGTTGSGKTTLATQLSERLALPHVELDALFWEPDWTPAPRELLRARVAEALAGPRWVVCGNYSVARDLVWSQGDTLVWLNYALPLILWRLFWRTVRRVALRETLWTGNQENFRKQFLSRDSLFLWALKSHPRRNRTYPALLQQPDYAHLTVLRFTDPRATAAWLASLKERDCD